MEIDVVDLRDSGGDAFLNSSDYVTGVEGICVFFVFHFLQAVISICFFPLDTKASVCHVKMYYEGNTTIALY